MIVQLPDEDPHNINNQVKVGHRPAYKVETPPNSPTTESHKGTKEEGMGLSPCLYKMSLKCLREDKVEVTNRKNT